MSRINQTRDNSTKAKAERNDAHLNYMGGLSYDISNPIHALRLAASSCFFGEPQYYKEDKEDTRKKRPLTDIYGRRTPQLESDQIASLEATLNSIDPQSWRGKTPAEAIEMAIDAALEFDPEKTLQEAVRLRNEEHIRTTPQVILVRAANHPKTKGTELISKYAPQIIKRADEPSVCVAYQLWRYPGTSIKNSLKKALAKALSGFDEYSLAKYRQENKTVKTVDVVNLVHPKSEAIHKLVRGELKNSDKTWEAIISAKGSTPEAWTEAIEVMGHMALLRNVRNLLEKGLSPDLFVAKLVEGAKKGQQLPFRYYSAYRAVEAAGNPRVLDAIETCLMESVDRLPHFGGRVMSLCDNSGSARGAATSSMGSMQVSTIANLTGVLTGMAADEGYLGVFGDNLEVMPVRKRSSVFEQLKKADGLGGSVGGGTENGIWLFWDKAIKNKEHWDHVFVYSDMQAGHGGLYGTNPEAYKEFIWGKGGLHIDVPKLVAKYRREVNPNVMVYLVQVAGYQDTIMPEHYHRTAILGGWGEGLLKFAKYYEALFNNAPATPVQVVEPVTAATQPQPQQKKKAGRPRKR